MFAFFDNLLAFFIHVMVAKKCNEVETKIKEANSKLEELKALITD